MNKQRCAWLNYGQVPSEIYIKYHDEEWGIAIHDDRLLFEFLILEGAQAGLSWITILNKRSNYRKAYDNFDPSWYQIIMMINSANCFGTQVSCAIN